MANLTVKDLQDNNWNGSTKKDIYEVVNGITATINSHGGNDVLDFTKVSNCTDLTYSNFTKVENNLVITLNDDKNSDNNIKLTIQDYFSTTSNTVNNTVKTIRFSANTRKGYIEKNLTDYLDGISALQETEYLPKKGVITGSMFIDKIDLSDDKIEPFKVDKRRNEIGYTINAGAGNDTIIGSKFNDTIKAISGNNLIEAGKGTDKIYAGKGSDNFVIKSGDSTIGNSDIIYNSDISDKLSFANDGTLSFEKINNDLYIKHASDEVIVSNYFRQKEGTALNNIDNNGTAVNISNETININALKGGKVNGTYLNDNIIADGTKSFKIYTGKGNDTITSGSANDTINITGDGNKVINIANTDGKDTITGITNATKTNINIGDFSSGFTANDIMYSRAKNNLVLTRAYQDISKTYQGSVYLTADGTLTTSSNRGKNQEVTGKTLYKQDGKYYLDNSNLKAGYETVSNLYLVSKKLITELTNTTIIKDYFKSNSAANLIVNDKEVLALLNGDDFKELRTYSKGADYKKKQTITATFLNDSIVGGKGNDKINTGAGDDTIIAGLGNDTINLTGNGVKTIYISNLDGNDTITGANKSNLRLMFNKDTVLTYEQGTGKNSNDLIITRTYDVANEKIDLTKKKLYLKNGIITTSSKGGAERILDNLYVDKKGNYKILSSATEGYTKVDVYKYGKLYTTEATHKATSTTTLKNYYAAAENTTGDSVISIKDDSCQNIFYCGNNNKVTYKFDEGANLSYELDGKNLVIKFGDGNGTELVIKDFMLGEKEPNPNVFIQIGENTPDNLYKQLSFEITGEGHIEGSVMNDNITGSNSADTILGGEGNDFIDGGNGADYIEGGEGNDTLIGGVGNDTLKGGSGNDTFVLKSGDGNDVIYFDGGANTLKFEDQHLSDLKYYIDIHNSSDLIIKYGEDFADSVTLVGYLDSVDNGDNPLANIITLDGTTTTEDVMSSGMVMNIDGTDDAEEIIGTDLDDYIQAGGGNDTIDGGEGDDTIDGGTGSNYISGGAGSDSIIGGDGADTIDGGDDDDTIYGGRGNDTLKGGSGDNTFVFRTGDGNDVVYLDNGANTLKIEDQDLSSLKYYTDKNASDLIIKYGGEYSDSVTLVGYLESVKNGNNPLANIITLDDTTTTPDEIFTSEMVINIDGTDEAEVINAPDINTYIQAGGGNDIISGGAGNDTIIAGDGNDTIYGGSGENIYEYTKTDFGQDTLYLTGEKDILKFPADTPLSYTINGRDVQITASGGADFIIIKDFLSEDGTSANENIYLQFGTDEAVKLSAQTFNIYYAEGLVNGTFLNDDIQASYGQVTIYGHGGNDKIFALGGADYVDGGEGNDTIYGGEGNDTLLGGIGNDEIDGQNGNDSIDGGTGNDYLMGRAGEDTIYGGSGNDSIWGGQDNDYIDGGDDDDKLYGEEGNDTIIGGAGNDSIYGGIGNDSIEGGDGNDYIRGEAGADTIFGGAGKDTIEGGDDGDLIDGGDGNDFIDGGAGKDTLLGGAGNDYLDGGDDNDSIDGGEGDDTLKGGNGNDTLKGGEGNDTIYGNGGNNYIDGGAGNDYIYADKGDSTIYGGSGDNVYDYMTADVTRNFGKDTMYLTGEKDTIKFPVGVELRYAIVGNDARIILDENNYITVKDFLSEDKTIVKDNVFVQVGLDNENLNQKAFEVTGDGTISGTFLNEKLTGGNGNDSIYGYAGNDTIYGGAGADYIEGGVGNDLIYGGNGNDTIYCNFGQDTVFGGAGNDSIIGGVGFDSIDGGEGDDYIEGGEGGGMLYGGSGNDTIFSNMTNDIIDGGSGDDTIILGSGVKTLSFDYNSDNDTIYGVENTTSVSLNYDIGGLNVDGLSLSNTSYNNDLIITIPVTNVESGKTQITTTITDFYLEDSIRKVSINDTKIVNTSWFSNLYNGHVIVADNDNGAEINGSGSNDFIVGGEGNDTIHCGTQWDTIYAGAGDDYINCYSGSKLVYAGSGDDTIVSGSSDDTIYGGSGENVYDYTVSGRGKDTLYLTGEKDILLITELDKNKRNYIYTLNKNDLIITHKTDNRTQITIKDYIDDERNVNDNIYIKAGEDYFEKLSVASAINVSGSGEINGTNINDSITGGSGEDTIFGGDGNDTIYGGTGNDVIYGGDGNDYIFADGGADTIYGGKGEDHIRVAKSSSGMSNGTIIDGQDGGDYIIIGSSDTSNYYWLQSQLIKVTDSGTNPDDSDNLCFYYIDNPKILFNVYEDGGKDDKMLFLTSSASGSEGEGIVGNKETHELTITKGVIAENIETFNVILEHSYYVLSQDNIDAITEKVVSWLNNSAHSDYHSVADVFATTGNSADRTELFKIFNPTKNNAWVDPKA